MTASGVCASSALQVSCMTVLLFNADTCCRSSWTCMHSHVQEGSTRLAQESDVKIHALQLIQGAATTMQDHVQEARHPSCVVW